MYIDRNSRKRIDALIMQQIIENQILQKNMKEEKNEKNLRKNRHDWGMDCGSGSSNS